MSVKSPLKLWSEDTLPSPCIPLTSRVHPCLAVGVKDVWSVRSFVVGVGPPDAPDPTSQSFSYRWSEGRKDAKLSPRLRSFVAEESLRMRACLLRLLCVILESFLSCVCLVLLSLLFVCLAGFLFLFFCYVYFSLRLVVLVPFFAFVPYLLRLFLLVPFLVLFFFFAFSLFSFFPILILMLKVKARKGVWP